MTAKWSKLNVVLSCSHRIDLQKISWRSLPSMHLLQQDEGAIPRWTCRSADLTFRFENYCNYLLGPVMCFLILWACTLCMDEVGEGEWWLILALHVTYYSYFELEVSKHSSIRFRNVYQLLFSPTTLEQLLFGYTTHVVGQSILEVAENLGEHVSVTKL
jgi:hypothetical protein